MTDTIQNVTLSSFRAPVSFHDEPLILVDSGDRVVGFSEKRRAHEGVGTLHRAFSVFLFDQLGRVLIHRRSLNKPLWPGYWTNSCCSHPRRGEDLENAVARRLYEELGVTAPAYRVYDFEYRASFGDIGTEHELCHVFLASVNDPSMLSVHEEEIMDWQWLHLAEVDALFRERADEVTPWFTMEWQALRGEYAEKLNSYLRMQSGKSNVATGATCPDMVSSMAALVT